MFTKNSGMSGRQVKQELKRGQIFWRCFLKNVNYGLISAAIPSVFITVLLIVLFIIEVTQRGITNNIYWLLSSLVINGISSIIGVFVGIIIGLVFGVSINLFAAPPYYLNSKVYRISLLITIALSFLSSLWMWWTLFSFFSSTKF
ncbi:MAG: hypothetical protein KME64_06635 [Scytonematopsis contorta HA4267-MV1]|jgi:uncharacterized protein YacL|nr:hypothetical protein [Scytonematopsis contorta HA4267-MV1]